MASFPELSGCLTCADTIVEVVQNAEDAKIAWIHAVHENGMVIPEPEGKNEYSGQFKLRIPKALHRQLAEHSKAEGISMNQYCLFLLTKYDEAYYYNADLAREEERLSKKKALELFESGMLDKLEAGKFSALKAIHKYLFDEIYDFAGEIRTINISKGSFRFAPLM